MATRQPLSGQTQQTNSPDAVRKQGRDPRQRQTARRVNLQPQASPGSYYSRPANKQVGQKSEQLAGALSKLSPEVGKLGSYLADKKRTEAQKEAKAASQQMTPEEMREAINSGEIAEHENPYFQAAYQKQYGIRLGLQQGRKVKASMKAGNFNPREQSAEEFIAENMSVDASKMHSNEIVEEGFSAAMDQSISQVREMAAGQRADAVREDTLQGAHEIDREMTRETFQQYQEAETPEEKDAAYESYRDNLESVRENLSKELGLSNKELDAIHLGNLEEAADKGQFELVKRIVTDDRDGVGSLVGKRGAQGTKAQKLMDVAEKNRDEKNREEAFETRVYFDRKAARGQFDMAEARQFQKNNPGSITDAEIRQWAKQQERERQKQVRAAQADRRQRAIDAKQSEEQAKLVGYNIDMIKNNKVGQIQPVTVTGDDGEPTVLSVEDQVQKATEVLVNEQIPEDAKEEFPDDEQAQRQYIADKTTLAEQQAGSNYDNKPRERRFGAVETLLSPQTISSNDGEAPEPAINAVKEFREVYTRSPSRARKDAGDSFDLLKNIVDVGNQLDVSIEEATKKVANQRSANSGEGLDYNASPTNKEWKDIKKDQYGDLFTTEDRTFLPDKKDDIKNEAMLRKKHDDMAEAIALGGGNPTPEAVADRVKDHNMMVNGNLVTYNGSAGSKQQLQDELNGIIDDVAENNKGFLEENGTTADDLAVGVDSKGDYYIMFEDGEPLLSVEDGGEIEGDIPVSDINESTIAKRKTERRDEELEERQRRSEREAKYDEDYPGSVGVASPEEVESNMPTSLDY